MRTAGDLLVSPVFAGAIGLLLLNDHVLKAAWPGLVTGKLSDVAGVAMVAILCTALFRRAGLAFGLTVAGFVLLKSVPVVAVWASPLLGGVTRTDPTDLLALAALVPLWGWVHRVGSVPLDRDIWAHPIRVALIGAAVFATSATSCDVAGVTRLTEFEGVLYAVDTGGDVFTSRDGFDWGRLDGGRTVGELPTAGWTKRSDCAGGRCFDIEATAEGVAVVEVATSTVLLQLTRSQQLALTDAGPQQSCSDVSLFHLDAFERDGGVHLVVSTGSTGVLAMDDQGVWRWGAVGRWGLPADAAPSARLDLEVATEPDRSGTEWGRVVAASIPGAVLVVALAAAVTLVRRSKRVGGRWWILIVTMLGLGTAFGAAYAALLVSGRDGGGNDLGIAISYVGFALFSAVVFAMGLAIAAKWAGPSEPPHLPPPLDRDRLG